MFERTIATLLNKTAPAFPLVVLTGPRQSGKTTLLRHLFKDFEYIYLEAPDVLLEVKSDPRRFLNKKVKGWIFDEAQRFPDLFSYIQEYLEDSPQIPIILTGSQSFLFNENISQSLAGRAAILELLPLSYSELTSDKKFLNIGLYQMLYNGLYPRPYHENLPIDLWYQSYIQTYLERDVRQISNIGNLSQFQLFLKLCAGSCGQLLNLESIAGDCGVSQPTAKRWLSILESSRVIFLLQPHFKNFRKRLVKRPKLYFYDSSIVCGLLGISSEDQLFTHSMRGAIFESFVVSEICKHFYNRGKTPPIYFWRDHRGLEVDVVLDIGGELKGIEIKSGSTLANDFSKPLLKWKEISGTPIENLSIIYGGDKVSELDGLKVLPWKKITSLFS